MAVYNSSNATSDGNTAGVILIAVAVGGSISGICLVALIVMIYKTIKDRKKR